MEFENVFGEGIPFREGNPIQLLNYIENEKNSNEFGEIIVNEEALDIIREIDGPVAIISVVGSYRRGKSWFANVLHGRHDGFMLGSTVDRCTQGIYMWSKPFDYQGKKVIILDCEGIDDPKQNQQWATKLFVLCLSISSTFIYNLNGVVGKDDIGKLFLMTDLTKFIVPPPDYKFLPRMVVLLRDFMLKNPESFKDYFLDRLNSVNERAAEGIKKYFSDFDVFGIPIPMADRNQLQNLDKLPTAKLQPEFVTEVTRAVNNVLSTSAPKYIGSCTMTGLSLTKFLQDCVEKLNDTSNIQLSIPSEYDSVVEYVAQRSIKECVQMYTSYMNKKLNKDKEGDDNNLYVDVFNWKVFNEIHLEIFNQVEKEFFKRIIGDSIQIRQYENELNNSINEQFEKFRKSNSEALYEYNMELAKKLWENNVKVRLSADNFFKDQDEFDDAIAIFEREVIDTLIEDCPETERVMAKFKSDEYQDAITTLKSIGILKNELAEQIKSVQESEQKYLEFSANEKETKIKMEKIQVEYEEIKRQLLNKIKEIDENIEKQKITNIDVLERANFDRELALTLLNSEKEREIESLKKELKKIKQKKEDWVQIIQSLIPLLHTGLKFAASLYLAKPKEYPITLHNSTLNGQLLTSLLSWQTISYLRYFRHSGRFTFRYEGFSKLDSLNDLLVHLSRRRNEYLVSGDTTRNPGSVYRFKLPTICSTCYEVGHKPKECNAIDITLSRRMLSQQEIDITINQILEFNCPVIPRLMMVGLCAMADIFMINKTLKSVDLTQQNSVVSLEFLEKIDKALLHNTKLICVHFNTKGLQLRNSSSASSNLNYQKSVLTSLDEKKNQMFSRIVKNLQQNCLFDSPNTAAMIELVSKARIFLLNNLNCNVLMKVPPEVWIQIFSKFGEERGLSKRQVDVILKYAGTRSTLSKDINERKFLESIYTNNIFWE
ncbi:guanylate-binding protein [Rhizophagus clarus]|uniref:Guanylate-binding protein n=1 Tax=Rhizophagus clarus TaxID=94130 RepID=A0A8H3M9V4_9GLOM|nr:guanylate-binding protein [Rhizophagus clarus]